MNDVEVAIVGGGPAGLVAAAALLRAAPGLAGRVVVLEKATYPREKLCAGGLGDRGWRVLGDLDLAVDVPHVPVAAIRLSTGRATMLGRPGGRIGRVVRRVQFDAALAEKVRSCGVRVEEGAGVRRLSAGPDGVTLETSRGPVSARVVVGADGVGSIVRRAMGLHAGALRAMVLEVDTPDGDGDPARDTLHFEASWPELPGYVWDFPTVVDGEPLWCRGVYALRARQGVVAGLPPVEVDLEGRLGAWLAGKGLDLAGCRRKRFGERGYEPRSVVVDGRLLLVGEAAGIDPISGEGIAQAIEGGARLGRFLADGDRGPVHLAGWQRVFSGSRLGRDLRVRAGLLGPVYSPRRALWERVLAGNDALLRAGCRHWAATPQPVGDVGAGLLRALGRLATGAA